MGIAKKPDAAEHMKFDCKQITDELLARRQMRILDLAKELGCTPNNIMNKRRRNDMRIEELANIAQALDYDLKVVFKDKATGEEVIFTEKNREL